MNKKTTSAACLLIAFATILLFTNYGWRQSALMLVGAGAGIALYHAAFGFTASWRELILRGDGSGLRAQMLMLAATTIVFLPIIAHGEVFGTPVRGSVAPLAVSGIVGAFLFGIGMQLGGGCASGTLYTVGGGSTRMTVTLFGFIAGSVLGAWSLPVWDDLPRIGTFSLLENFGLSAGLASNLALLAAVVVFSIWIERISRARRRDRSPNEQSAVRWLTGPWPLVAGALALALVNIATLTLAGRPWGVTSAFALWGSKLLGTMGLDVGVWAYWSSPERAASLAAPVFSDITSVMDVGIMLGAALAAGLAGRFSPVWRVPLRSVAAALLGGILLGYGARLAYGCNIGAFFSGVASSSLHGWLWFIAAFIGNIAGTRLRPMFRLA
jgi:uncharacterized membrane protein YedE/YeeE